MLSSPEPKTVLTTEDFKLTTKDQLAQDEGVMYKFKDYAPGVFRKVSSLSLDFDQPEP
jgi:hypothetical protein